MHIHILSLMIWTSVLSVIPTLESGPDARQLRGSDRVPMARPFGFRRVAAQSTAAKEARNGEDIPQTRRYAAPSGEIGPNGSAGRRAPASRIRPCQPASENTIPKPKYTVL